MLTVYACGSSGGDSQQREIADGADVVFTDTGVKSLCKLPRQPVYAVGAAGAVFIYTEF